MRITTLTMSDAPSTMDVNFTTQTLGTPGTVASTLTTGSGVRPSSQTMTNKARSLTARDEVIEAVKPYTASRDSAEREVTKLLRDVESEAPPSLDAVAVAVRAIRRAIG